MSLQKLNLKKIAYINIKYLLVSKCNTNKLDEDTYKTIESALDSISLSNKALALIDMEKVTFSSTAILDKDQPKKSVIFFTFNKFIKNENIDFVFINVKKEISLYFMEKDFSGFDNIFIVSFYPEPFFADCSNSEINNKQKLIKKLTFLSDFSFLDSSTGANNLIENLISLRVRELLENKKCIKPIELQDHILRSTQVHVNKYVNLKPLIEDYNSFIEVCYFLSERIKDKFCEPDFLVAASKNAISIASGLMQFFVNCNIIIINQVSPITAYNNYSNLSSIKPNCRYAIIEDFQCMGTEVKVVKGILWSHGVNVDEDVYSFPIASTTIYEKDYSGGYIGHKIYPLYKLEDSIDYKIFTHDTCPVCNDIDCFHRKLFPY